MDSEVEEDFDTDDPDEPFSLETTGMNPLPTTKPITFNISKPCYWDLIDDDYSIIIIQLKASRYWSPRIYTPPAIKLEHWFNQPKLQKLRSFRLLFRMSRESFEDLLFRIEQHVVFQNQSHQHQTPVRYQLAVFLYRLGGKGGNGSHAAVALAVGIGEGTVSLFSNRVRVAIQSLKKDIIRWPTVEEKAAHKQRVSAASCGVFQGCIGFVDGTYITLEYAPLVDWYSYFNRKSSYGLNAMVVCDDRCKIIYMRCGETSAVHDARVFAMSQLAHNHEQFFDKEQQEYLIGDSAYTCNDRMIIPFKKPRSNDPYCRLFNATLSSRRIAIEHVFGQLKSRFPSITKVSIQIKGYKEHKAVVEWFEAACIIHNFLKLRNDSDWDELEDLQLANAHQNMVELAQPATIHMQNGQSATKKQYQLRENLLENMKQII